MTLHLLCVAVLSASLSVVAGPKPDYKAGVAKVDITPTEPIYMSGYASRTHPSTGVAHPLFAKALAIEDTRGGRVVIVTTDLVGLPRSITDLAAAQIQKQYGLDRARLVFNSSHTHTGPLVRDNLMLMFDLDAANQAVVQRYGQRLQQQLVDVAGAALGDLQPANLWFAHGKAQFAINRREPTPKGVKIGLNPQGPTDPDVPVIKVTSPDGTVRAILTGYACHNTTLTGEFYELSGDYAGYAQTQMERDHPGAVALFMELCGGDQNPNPRSTAELAKQHGATLADAVKKVTGAPMQRVSGATRAAFQLTELNFAYKTREDFEARLKDSNVWRVRHAKAMLRLYDERHPIRSYAYPVQAIQFGKDVTLLTLGGEVVVDYALRAKKQYGDKGLIVAGYSNDVMCYIASKRVLLEGGYEADDSMIYYGQPGPWAEDTEERIFATIAQVMDRVRGKRR